MHHDAAPIRHQAQESSPAKSREFLLYIDPFYKQQEQHVQRDQTR